MTRRMKMTMTRRMKIGEGWTKEELLEVVPTARSVPQIFLGEEYVGGFPELKQKLAA